MPDRRNGKSKCLKFIFESSTSSALEPHSTTMLPFSTYSLGVGKLEFSLPGSPLLDLVASHLQASHQPVCHKPLHRCRSSRPPYRQLAHRVSHRMTSTMVDYGSTRPVVAQSSSASTSSAAGTSSQGSSSPSPGPSSSQNTDPESGGSPSRGRGAPRPAGHGDTAASSSSPRCNILVVFPMLLCVSIVYLVFTW